MKVTFVRDFDFAPAALGGRVTVAHKAGREYQVTRECEAAARKAGALAPSKRAVVEDQK